ncbi:MAG: hypothetical protein H6Q70_3174 [Firmicutes bacterium]|nr:hypothetical protein [Bacillota bacterium]
MSDDAIQKLFNKIDDLADRLARVETMLEKREMKQTNIASIIAWLATTAVAIYGVIH